MQRLIDANELKMSVILPRCGAKTIIGDAIRKMIDQAPTIDAIPVSFIQELIKQDNQFIEAYGGIQECEVIVDGLNERVVNYEALIEKWREQNDTKTD